MKPKPILSCGFRPFFLLATGYSVILMTMWAFFWTGWPRLPENPGGPIVWHAYELIFGFLVAGVTGFLTTAAPEFLKIKDINGQRLLLLVSLWTLGRVAFWSSGFLGLIPAAVFNMGLLIYLLYLLAPAFWRDPGRKQMAFIYSLVILLVIEGGFYTAAIRGLNAMPWLYAAVNAGMILIIVALSRISMRIINNMEEGVNMPELETPYLARPPRRNMAIFTISLFALGEFFLPGNDITGWLALAAASAVLNLLNDWHIGRPLFNRWVFSMYAVYWCMAMGFLGLGLSMLFDWPIANGARHFLTTGSMGLALFLVMVVAGFVHTGRNLLFQPWIGVAAISLLLSTLLRAAVVFPQFTQFYIPLIVAAAAFWCLAFGLYFLNFFRPLTQPAVDGRTGCL